MTKTLLLNFLTYHHDLTLLSSSCPHATPLLTHTTPLHLLLSSPSTQALLRKHTYEVKHGVEIRAKFIKYFTATDGIYLDYFHETMSKYHTITRDDPTHHYIGLCCLLLKPLFFIDTCFERGFKQLKQLHRKSVELQKQLLTISKQVELKRDVFHQQQDIDPSGWGHFLRQGVLLKLSKKKGLQARIVFLFTNALLYCTRISSSAGFRLHGLLSTSQLSIQPHPPTGIPHCLTLTVVDDEDAGEKLLILAAFSEEDKQEWMDSLTEAITTTTTTTKGIQSSSEEFTELTTPPAPPPPPLSRSNLTTHVCWHRNLSLSSDFILTNYKKQNSCYLLRKFKSSPGWQRLWVVYSNLCLYFYKSHLTQEPPLASLPLLGYRVEDTEKPNIFKLTFKNHVYYFKCDSVLSLQEWVGLLGGLNK